MILKNSVLLAFFSGLSIILGIVRDRLLSEYVGVGPTLDVYNAAFRVPDWTLAIMLSFASALTVVPFLTQAVHKEDTEDIKRRFSSLFIFFGGSMILLGAIVISILPFIAKYIVPGFSPEQTTLYIFATSLLMVQPLLLGLSTLISSLAQVRHQFIVYSVAPLFYTATIIYSVILYPTYGFKVLILGVTVGAFIHIAVQSYTLFKQGISVKFSLFDFNLVKEHLKFATPRSGSYIVNRSRDIIFSSVATTFGPGALSIFTFAQRVTDAYMQIMVQSISTASLPKLSLHHAKGETEIYTKTVRKSIVLIFVVSCLMSLTIFLLKEPLLLFLYGKNAPIDKIGNLLVLLSIGMPMFAINFYFASAFSATKNNLVLFVSNSIATVCSIFALFFFKNNNYGLNSIGLASIVMSTAYMLLLFYVYSRNRTTGATH